MDVRAQKAPWLRGIEMLFREITPDGIYTADSLVMVKRDPGMIYKPTVEITMECAQTLIDDLWHAGLRPTEGTGSAGALAATERHLQDMRRLVFEKKEG